MQDCHEWVQNILTYRHIIGQELLAISHGKRDGIFDFGAILLLAEMSVANSLVAVGVKI